MSSFQITELLRCNHTKDVFVSECKDGSTQFFGHARMDAWVMNRSWVRLCFTGYEIKVSRADFKQDEKWHSYLPLCNQLYFVCPKGMIEPDEMPDGVGLKYCTESQVRTVKKASFREVQPPMELFVYVLMCRSRIVAPNFYEPESGEEKVARYKKWLADKSESRRLGEILSYEISRHTDEVQAENKRLKSLIERWKKIEGLAKDAGITQWDDENRMVDRLAQFKKLVPDEYVDLIRNIECESGKLVKKLENHRS